MIPARPFRPLGTVLGQVQNMTASTTNKHHHIYTCTFLVMMVGHKNMWMYHIKRYGHIHRYQKDINHFVLFTRSKLLIVKFKVFINVYSIEWNKIVWQPTKYGAWRIKIIFTCISIGYLLSIGLLTKCL